MGTPSVAGTYNFTVSVTSGLQYNSRNFTLVINPPVFNNTPSVSFLSPSSGRVGSSVTIYGSGFGTSWNTVYFGSNLVTNVYSMNGTSMTFNVPFYTNPACLYSNPACAMPQTQITPGVYPVSVYNAYGTSNAVNFTVTSF